MRIRFTTKRASRWVAGILLLALAYPALVPAGFMPAAGSPLSLQICHGGMMEQHAGGHSQLVSCLFTAVPSAGAHVHTAPPPPFWVTTFVSVAALERLRLGARRDPAHQPRGPPSLA
jgi:hypothetical protein